MADHHWRTSQLGAWQSPTVSLHPQGDLEDIVSKTLQQPMGLGASPLIGYVSDFFPGELAAVLTVENLKIRKKAEKALCSVPPMVI